MNLTIKGEIWVRYDEPGRQGLKNPWKSVRSKERERVPMTRFKESTTFRGWTYRS